MREQKVGSGESVIAIVKGGLGNQLFIYAAARAFALRTGRKLFLDSIRGFQKDGYGRQYRLDRFPIQAATMPEEWKIAPDLKHLRHKTIRAFNKFLPRESRSYLSEIREQGAEQLTALFPIKSRVTLLGYWQDEDYFSDFSLQIRDELAVPAPSDSRNSEAGKRYSEIESVSLHIRRVRYNPCLTSDYYQKAIGKIKERIANPHFVVFGDDPEWARRELDFGGCGMDLVTHNPEDELADLWLMGQCRHAIVANSSFSWWGAWLGGRHEDQAVCFPSEPALPIRSARGWHRIPNLVHWNQEGNSLT